MRRLRTDICRHAGRENPKKVGDGPKFDLTYSQAVVYYYLLAARMWGWSQEDVDKTDIEHFFDMLTVANLTSEPAANKQPKKVFIDQTDI